MVGRTPHHACQTHYRSGFDMWSFWPLRSRWSLSSGLGQVCFIQFQSFWSLDLSLGWVIYLNIHLFIHLLAESNVAQ